MSSVKIEISGYIRTDPAEKATTSGTKVLEFSVPHKNRKGETEWYNCALFGDKRVSALNWIAKDMGVHLRGELTINEGKDGKIYRNVAVDQIDIFGNGKKEEALF